MNVGIVGNRDGWTYEHVKEILLKEGVGMHDVIISGGADGVDTFAQQFAKEMGCKIIIHYPKWNISSPKRYFERNKQIVLDADFLIAFDKKVGATGTKNTIAEAKKANKASFLYNKEL